MKHLPFRMRGAVGIFLLFCAVSLSWGCARVAVHTHGLPPVLAQDEVLKPYDKLGTITVRRDRYGDPEALLTPDDYQWAYQALREKAAEMHADAVILPEVTVEATTYLFYPTSHVTGKGVAIKFK